jgi:hypothetical protein
MKPSASGESKKLGIREVALERPPRDVAARGGSGGV